MQAAKQKAASARRAVEELMAAEEEEQRKAQARVSKGNQQRAKAKQQSAKLPAQAQLTQALPPQAVEQGEAGAQRQQAQQLQAIQTPLCDGAQEADADSAKAEAKRAKKQRQKAKKQSAQQQAAPPQPAQQSSVPQQASVVQQPESQQQQSARQPDAQQIDLAPAFSTVKASRQTRSDTARKRSVEASGSLQGDDHLLMPQLPDANAASMPSSSRPSPDSADPGGNETSSYVLGKQPTGAPAAAAAALTCGAHDRSQLPLAIPSTIRRVASPAAAAAPPGLGFEPTQQEPKGKGQSAVGSMLPSVTGSCQASSSPHVPPPQPQIAGPAADVAMTWQKQSNEDKPAVQPNTGGATKSLGQKPGLPTASSNTDMLDGILTPYTAPAKHVELLFQCPLTKVSASNLRLLLASVQPDDMLWRCARLHM